MKPSEMEKDGMKINEMGVHIELDKSTKLMDLLDSLFVERIVRKVDDKNNFYDRYYYPYITPIERPNFQPINLKSFYLHSPGISLKLIATYNGL